MVLSLGRLFGKQRWLVQTGPSHTGGSGAARGGVWRTRLITMPRVQSQKIAVDKGGMR